MKCAKVREWLDEYCHGAPAPRVKDEMDGHLSRCAACAKELARHQAAVGALEAGVTRFQAPEALDEILAAVRGPRPRWEMTGRAWALAACVPVVAAMIWVWIAAGPPVALAPQLTATRVPVRASDSKCDTTAAAPKERTPELLVVHPRKPAAPRLVLRHRPRLERLQPRREAPSVVAHAPSPPVESGYVIVSTPVLAGGLDVMASSAGWSEPLVESAYSIVMTDGSNGRVTQLNVTNEMQPNGEARSSIDLSATEVSDGPGPRERSDSYEIPCLSEYLSSLPAYVGCLESAG